MNWASQHPLGYKIFLDRYALKGRRENAKIGDLVVVLVDSATERREIGHITALNEQKVYVRLLDSNEESEFSLEAIDLPLETTLEQMIQRVARGVAAVEEEQEVRDYWERKFRWLLEDWKFVPGGRILTAAGTNQQLTMYNCFVLPSPHDSRGGIMKTLTDMAETMSRGGGVGINISSLRPHHAYVKGVNGRSSGSVSWGALYSFVTGLVEQAGCFAPHERIMTDIGLISAQELVERLENDERIYAHTHKGLRRITDKFRNGRKNLFKVTTARGYTNQITSEHKIARLNGKSIETTPLRKLQVGDEILTLLGSGAQTQYQRLIDTHYVRPKMSYEPLKSVTLPQVLDEQLAYLLGYMYGDGYVVQAKEVNYKSPKGISLATADAHPAIREKLIAASEQVFGITPTVYPGDGALQNVVLYSRVMIDWLITNGLLKAKTEDIRVPEIIFRSSSSVMGAFVAGYFDADGCNRGAKSGYGIDSVSREMLEDVQQLLAFNGIVSRLNATNRDEQGWQTIYRLNVTGRIFKTRFANFAHLSEKVNTSNGTREETTYPVGVLTGVRRKYTAGIYDGRSERVSVAQVEKVVERLEVADEEETALDLRGLLNVIPDTIVSIEPVGEDETYDFEVDDVHLLSSAGIYSSNSRRGALMLILNDWHPDVLEFISSKRSAGKITNANISVGVSDTFMKAVEDNSDWHLRFPDTSFAVYDQEWDGDLETWEAKGYPVIHYKTVKAREIWDAIIESAWASAEPGLWFRDRANQYWNGQYYSKLISTNPCVTGDTLVSTKDGMIAARDLKVGMLLEEPGKLGESDWYPIQRIYNNGEQPIWIVETSTGRKLRCTGDHKLLTLCSDDDVSERFYDCEQPKWQTDGQYCGPYWFPVNRLKIGDQLQTYEDGLFEREYIINVELTEDVEEVFDVYEPHTLTWLTNGFISFDCGEQPLSSWAVCNLGALNLAKFYSPQTNEVDWGLLTNATQAAVRFLDNIIDVTPYFFEENRELQQGERRVGLGIMGLAELLIKMRMRYGSPESIEFIRSLFEFIAVNAYDASVSIAIEKGAFTKFDSDGIMKSAFIQKLPQYLRDDIQHYGLRNVTLLTVAPTGSTGTMANTSTGIEPFFSWTYYRKGRLGLHEENVAIAQEWFTGHPEDTELPPWFVTAMDLTPEEHVRVQAAAQEWVDTSISKTANLPNNYTIEQVSELYKLMYDLGCKGGTVYRDGSRSEQVLITKKDKAENVTANELSQQTYEAEQVGTKKQENLLPLDVADRPKGSLSGKTIAQASPWGTLFVTINEQGGAPFEVFLTVGKAGSELEADAQAMGRLMSLALRAVPPHQREDLITHMIDQLRYIGGERPSGMGMNRILSLPDAAAIALSKWIEEKNIVTNTDKIADFAIARFALVDEPEPYFAGHSKTAKVTAAPSICPTCKNKTLIREGGCKNCYTCGHSEC